MEDDSSYMPDSNKGKTLYYKADRAAALSRTLTKRPELLQQFRDAYSEAVNNGKTGVQMNVEILEAYNKAAGGHGFTGEGSKRRAEKVINKLNEDTTTDGTLTMEALTEFYDNLNLNEPFVDGNKRASILAITHVLNAHGYDGPDFSKSSQGRLRELQQQNPGNYKEATKQFLSEAIPSVLPSRSTI